MANEQLIISCTVTNGSNVVTTTGQTLLTTMAVSNYVRKKTQATAPVYTVLSVPGDNEFRLTVPYAGATETVDFIIQRSFTPNLHFPRFRSGDQGVPDMMTDKIIDVLDSVIGLIPSGSFVVGGSVVFTGPTGAFAQDNANFFWDDTNKRLGIGRVPTARLDIKSSASGSAGGIRLENSNDTNAAAILYETSRNAILELRKSSGVQSIKLDATSGNTSYLSDGNLAIGATAGGTALAKGFVLGEGTAPTSSPANVSQLWSQDRAGVAGTNRLHMRTEDGIASALMTEYDQAIATNPKAMSQGVYLTGATSGSSGLRVLNNANLNMNYNDFTIHFENLCLPDYTPTAVQILAQKWAASVGWSLELQTNGYLGLYINAGPYKNATTNIPTTNNKPIQLSMVVVRETELTAGSIKFYVNKIQLGNPIAIPAGVPTNWGNAAPLFIMGDSSKRTAGSLSQFYLFNRALSDEEIVNLGTKGIDFADQWGSQTAEYTTDFSTNTGWVVTAGVTIAGGVVTFQNVAGETTHRLYRTTGFEVGRIGTCHLLQYEVISNTLESGVLYFVGDSINKITHTDIALDMTVGVHAVYLPGPTAGSASYIFFDVIGAISSGSLVLDNISLWRLGATLALEPSGINAYPGYWIDSSSNHLNATIPATGVTPILDTAHGTIPLQGNSTDFTPVVGTDLTTIYPADLQGVAGTKRPHVITEDGVASNIVLGADIIIHEVEDLCSVD